MEQFNIAYVIDNNQEQLKMLRMSIETLLKFNKVDNIFIMYFLIDENLIKEELKDLEVNIGYFKFDISLVDKNFPILKNVCNGHLRYPSLSRWWITKIIPYDYFWYIDTDILFNANIRENFLKYQKNKLFFSFNRKWYKRIPKLISKENFKKKGFLHTKGLNAGILFINAKLFNELNIFNEIINFYQKNYDRIEFVNQSGYEYLLKKYSDKSIIKIDDYINIRPFINIPELFESQISRCKVFHCNGINKENFFKTYKIIMNK